MSVAMNDVEINGHPVDAPAKGEQVQVDEVIAPETNSTRQLGISEVCSAA
jgi:hypothetical protein